MNMSRFLKAALVTCVIAACVCGLAACSNSNSASGGVAATVNGTEIPEQKVTDQVEKIRQQSGLSDEEQWGKFLVENDMTPSSVREQIIDTLTEQELIVEGAAELGITVESSEVDEYIENMKSNYDSDDAWASALDQAGFTEDGYREVIEESLYEQKVGDYFEDKVEATDEDYVTSARTYASYYSGSKRSSHILFGVDDATDTEALSAAQAQAEDVLARINSGELDFAEAAKQYSTDTGSAENGGDVGWDTLNSFVTEYTDALENLELNQVSDPVTSQYGVHIIKVTDVYNAPENTDEITSLDQIPEAFQENIKEMAVSVKANSDYTDWLDGLKENADITVNDMPSGLPYDIDLTPYQEEDSEDDAASTDDATTVDVEDADLEDADIIEDAAVEDETVEATTEGEAEVAETEQSESSSAAAE